MAMTQRTVPVLRPEGFKRMAYTEWGAADAAQTVVCVHGLTRQGRDFDALAEALSADPRRRVLCPDVLGRGRSEWLADKAGYAYPQYMADMTTLLARNGAETVDWVGTSMGGLIGLFVAATPGNPIRRLVINDIGPLVPWEGLARIGTYVAEDPLFPDLDTASRRLRERTVTYGPLPEERWMPLVEASTRPDPEGKGLRLAYDPAIALAFQAVPQDQPIDLWALWDRVTVPVLVIRGAKSDLLPAEVAAEMQRRGPGCQVVEVPDAGHAPWLMTPDQMAPVVDFLTGHG
ncbi:Pimeloyl-ACP methyl ester carboxylesterase [Caenispirillum bisanense]|uniref:Pimeloyl-ACP methyl ester carboxylesterase n=2 Tax=Caenispirillum bisanense TaxID=414052 RepID=A0A286GFE6_9PROT|nr:Pimeloyl-ACP methyl ester carboxylesterase [Caenispirillum bisanense]